MTLTTRLLQPKNPTLKVKTSKSKITNEQCVVYLDQCGLCDMDFVGYTNRNLHRDQQRTNQEAESCFESQVKTKPGVLLFIDECLNVSCKNGDCCEDGFVVLNRFTCY